MDAASFTVAFLHALSDSRVQERLNECIGASLKHDLKCIQENQEKLSNSVKLLSEKCSQLQKENTAVHEIIKKRDAKIIELEGKLHEMNLKLDECEQNERKDNLKIIGLNESHGENTEEKIMELFNNTLGLNMNETTIKKAYRIGTRKDNGHGRPILVKFATCKARDEVFRNRTKLRKSSKPNVFINEDLTMLRGNWYHQARQLKREKKIMDCWTWDCSLLVKDKQGKIHKITSVEMLKNV